MPNRIIIADDGSGYDTKVLIEYIFSLAGTTECYHVWQKNTGFCVALIRNKALHKASIDDYIIQIDGDMVLEPHFIADHLYFAEKGFYVRGNKYLLSESETYNVLQNGLDEIPTLNIPFKRKPKGKRNVVLRNLFNMLHIDIKGVFGSNMGYWLSDALAINGYDNRFTGWGSEDDDFADRLRMSGIRCKSVKYGAIAYHLHHPPSDRSFVERNSNLRTVKRTIHAENGFREVLM